MLFVILLSIQILIGIALVGLILVQRSEGGALGIGGGGAGGGFMSARGAGNFLTRSTSILAILFFANCVALTVVSNLDRRGSSVVDQVGADNVTLDESQASAAAAAQAQQGQPGGASASSAAPSLTDLPSPTSAAPSLSNLGAPAAPAASSSASSSAAPKPAAPKPTTQLAKPAPASSASASSTSN
ncbi:preprotein translocase subunit SecG [Asticcacaulis sp. AND118]|uniref:preprotein translocase subunit SecG n=1 Tax=Asticcacaulis sp. AND118 TaxID=2840468 RepID=UPI001CFFBF4C|nr:preprotein translocase subunit SecG [Asticcacaulis sp. AND118]UDF02377.1 preprotein translocase subunit SecG [Asticcacaulis sp. AND118]